MVKQDFINIAHAAQHDAGNQAYFNKCMTAAIDALDKLPHGIIDPVAAFLSSTLLLSGDDTKKAIESMEFYMEELTRVKEALNEALNENIEKGEGEE